MRAIVAELNLRERVLLFLDMATGLRRGAIAGIKWKDFDFAELEIDVQRSIVDQAVGHCKTEASVGVSSAPGGNSCSLAALGRSVAREFIPA